jgi:hypothetical protein
MVRHEDRIFVLVVGAASIVAFLLGLAIFSTDSWAIGGKLAMFAAVVLLWACVLVPTTIFYFEERDKRVREERERWEAQEQRRLERKRLEEITSG